MNVRTKIIVSAVLLTALVGGYGLLHRTGALQTILDTDDLHAQVVRMGAWGPVAIVALMIVAVLISPIPSAPIALAAGAAYGHGWGTLYVLVGAEVGAMAAFGIARFVGHDTVHRWFGNRIAVGFIGTQNALMGLVFVSRLLPFLSFDIVSYAAGLTALTFWRFAVATLAGIAPSSFLLAHFGSELGSGETSRITLSVLALGGLTLIPVAAALIRDWRAKRRAARTPSSD